MQIAAAVLLIIIGRSIPWSNGYIAGVSVLFQLAGAIYLCLIITEKFFYSYRSGKALEDLDLKQHNIKKNRPRNDADF